MIANAIVSVYGLLVLFLPSESLLWRLVIALDLVSIIMQLPAFLHQNLLYRFDIVSYLCPTS